ncbi:MAG: PEP-CTERM sorting domain-containing protein [Phycisphaerales bacterium]
MKTRAALIVAALGIASSAYAQPSLPNASVTYTLSYTNSTTGTATPLNPGDSAQVKLTVLMAPPSGTPGTWSTTVSPGGSGTYRGIQAIFLDLIGTGGTTGAWTGNGVDELWDLAGPAGYGTPDPSGQGLRNIQAGQFPTGQAQVNITNPIENIWFATWTPASYTDRVVNFGLQKGFANPSTQGNNLIVRDPTLNTTVFIGTGADNFGQGLNIGIVPAPASLALLGLGGLVAARRRRA